MTLCLQDVFDLELFATDAGCLVPMNFSSDDLATGKAHFSNSFPLPQPPTAIPLTQARELANSGAGRYRLNLRYRSDDLELHASMLPEIAAPGNLALSKA
jgi:hypothetical protein